MYDRSLFPEPLEAWIHGPVVPELFHTYKIYGAGAIPSPNNVDFSCYDPLIREVLDEVYNVFGQFAAWKLRNLTHQEPPWENTPVGSEISHKAMRDYFKTQIVNLE